MIRLQVVAGPDYWADRAVMKRRAIQREQASERMKAPWAAAKEGRAA